MNYTKIFLLSAIIAILSFTFGYKAKDANLNRLYDRNILEIHESSLASQTKIYISFLNEIENENYQNAEKQIQGFLDINLSSLGAMTQIKDYKLSQDSIDAIKLSRDYINNSKTYRTVPSIWDSVQKSFEVIKTFDQ